MALAYIPHGAWPLLASVCIPLQLILEFEGGLKLAFCDARRFGKIRLQEDPANNEPVSKLGFDPVLDMIGPEDLKSRLAAQKRAIKTVILDQVCCAAYNHGILLLACPGTSCMQVKVYRRLCV